MEKNTVVTYEAYLDPKTHSPLCLIPQRGLINDVGTLYKFLDDNLTVVDFIGFDSLNDDERASREIYDSPASVEVYRNFLTWLFSTFNEEEASFREGLVKHLRLSEGKKVLLTGCGFGDELSIIRKYVGKQGEIHAQDLSKQMVLASSQTHTQDNIYFSVSSATSLPYASRYFDAVLHFGGINLFDDIKKGISEMERVCKVGGRVVFGDEGIAPHLLGTEYADVAITNNKLIAHKAPLSLLPTNANEIELSYILGNCYYIISFSPLLGFPHMNLDVEHKGLRGGSARTRYYGQLEGVSPETKKKVYALARKNGQSVHNLLEEIINKQIPEFPDSYDPGIDKEA